MNDLKGCSFLVSDVKAEQVFISEEWNEEQLMIKKMVRDFCISEIQEPMIKRGREFEISKDRDEILDIFSKASELGFCGVGVEEKYGGMDLDFNTGLLFTEELALGGSSLMAIGAQTSIGSLPIVFYGSDNQKAQYLPGIATGEIKCAYCLTEPEAGSDANAGKTAAILSEDDTHYILNGQKIWITNGGFADLFIVMAKIGDDKTLSAFIIEKAFDGVTTGPEEKKMGLKASSTVAVYFENVKVPVENLLAERGAGFKMALNILNTGRIKLAAGAMGGCKFAITKAVEYASERRQFGQPIAEFGAIQYKLGDMAAQTFACEAAVYRTGKNIDLKTEEFKQAGLPASEAKMQAVRDFVVECSILKVKASDIVNHVVDETLQVFGGMGYATETGIEMGYRDARILKIFEGTNEINRMLTLAELTKRAIKTKEVDLMKAGKKVPQRIAGQLLPFRSNGETLSEEKRLIKNIKSVFLLISGVVGRKLKEKMVQEQEIVMNLADILSEAYLTESVMLKVDKLQSSSDVDKDKVIIQGQMAQLYLYEALDIARKSALDAIASYATGIEKRTLNYFVKTLLYPYDVNPKQLRRNIADYMVKENGYCF